MSNIAPRFNLAKIDRALEIMELQYAQAPEFLDHKNVIFPNSVERATVTTALAQVLATNFVGIFSQS